MIRIYTDGSCPNNGSRAGGWSVQVVKGEELLETVTGGEKKSTNNRMELQAVLEALKYIENHELSGEVVVFSDSEYAVKGWNEWIDKWKKNGWKTTTGEVKNKDLWEEINDVGSRIVFELCWVKGHANNKFNKLADEAAVQTRKSYEDK